MKRKKKSINEASLQVFSSIHFVDNQWEKADFDKIVTSANFDVDLGEKLEIGEISKQVSGNLIPNLNYEILKSLGKWRNKWSLLSPFLV